MPPAYIKFRTYTECFPGDGDAYRRVSYEMLQFLGYQRVVGGNL